MVVNAEDLTILTINPAYKELLGGRDVTGLPLSDIFSGEDMDQLTRLLRQVVREELPAQTALIKAGVAGADGSKTLLKHTIVPILDETGAMDRLFIYSEKPE
jgi:hypothetical protein